MTPQRADAILSMLEGMRDEARAFRSEMREDIGALRDDHGSRLRVVEGFRAKWIFLGVAVAKVGGAVVAIVMVAAALAGVASAAGLR